MNDLMDCSLLSDSSMTSESDQSDNPLDDRLDYLTQSTTQSSLPRIRGVRLIGRGTDAGLYQITVQGHNSEVISVGRSGELRKASEIYDMVAIGLYGRGAKLNFAARRYPLDRYLNAIFTFQKLFPGEEIWSAVQRGLEAGVRCEKQMLKGNAPLKTFLKKVIAPRLQKRQLWQPQLTARWPPFCPPWATAGNDRVRKRGMEVEGPDSDSSVDEKKYSRRRRAYRVPPNGVVTHRVLQAFSPPTPVLLDDCGMQNKTRRGRYVKQPARFREEIRLDLSDSELAIGSENEVPLLPLPSRECRIPTVSVRTRQERIQKTSVVSPVICSEQYPDGRGLMASHLVGYD